MSRSVFRVLAFSLIVLMWMSLAPQPSHGQINFAPPRGANAISPTMSPDRPAAQAPRARAAVTRQETDRPATERRRSVSVVHAASSDPAPTHEGSPSRINDSQANASHANKMSASTPYTSMLYPVYLRSLNVRDEDPTEESAEDPTGAPDETLAPATRTETIHSRGNAEAHTVPAPSQQTASSPIRVSSYRVGQKL